MNIDERIKYAEEKRVEAFKINSMHFIDYWDGYIAALKEVKGGSRDKQIECERDEISEIIAQNFRLNDEQYDPSEFEWAAHCVQFAGYRKASEVAKVFTKYLAKLVDDKEILMCFGGQSGWFINVDNVRDLIAELNKKYT